MDYFLVQFQLVVSSPIDKGELNQTQISVHRIVRMVARKPAALLVAKNQPELK